MTSETLPRYVCFLLFVVTTVIVARKSQGTVTTESFIGPRIVCTSYNLYICLNQFLVRNHLINQSLVMDLRLKVVTRYSGPIHSIALFSLLQGLSYFKIASPYFLSWIQAKCHTAAMTAINRKENRTPEACQQLTHDHLQSNSTCNQIEENDTKAQLMPKGIVAKQAVQWRKLSVSYCRGM